MAKKPNLTALTFRDLVLGSDAETLRQALEARVRIDELVAERQAAYERIAALETQVEEVIGEPGVFPFPAPPLPVAGIDPKAETVQRVSSAPPASGKRGPARSATAAAPEIEPDDDDADEAEADTDADNDDAPQA